MKDKGVTQVLINGGKKCLTTCKGWHCICLFFLLRAACKGQNAYRVVVQVRASGSRN